MEIKSFKPYYYKRRCKICKKITMNLKRNTNDVLFSVEPFICVDKGHKQKAKSFHEEYQKKLWIKNKSLEFEKQIKEIEKEL